MHLIHVDAINELNQVGGTRTWLIIADSLFEAISLVPAGYCAKEMAVQPGFASGPARVIGWLGAIVIRDGMPGIEASIVEFAARKELPPACVAFKSRCSGRNEGAIDG
jgi:hypothetical protein